MRIKKHDELRPKRLSTVFFHNPTFSDTCKHTKNKSWRHCRLYFRGRMQCWWIFEFERDYTVDCKKKTRKEKFPNVNLILDNTYQIIFKNMNFDVNSNLSLVKRFHSHYEKLVKMYQFYSDSSRFFFATNCNNMVNDSCEKFNVLLRAKKVGRHC
jgi:hypothetical protein